QAERHRARARPLRPGRLPRVQADLRQPHLTRRSPMATPPSRPAPDPDRLKLYAFNLFTKLEGAVTSAMVHLGDRLGLYRALDAAGRPLSTAELADAAGMDERWVREWAYNVVGP